MQIVARILKELNGTLTTLKELCKDPKHLPTVTVCVIAIVAVVGLLLVIVTK